MASMNKPTRLFSSPASATTSPPGGYRPLEAMKKVSFNCIQDSVNPRSLPIPEISQSTQGADAALVDALQASQAANEALEAVIKLQARAIEQMMEENKKLCKQARGQTHSKPATCEASTQILADDASPIRSLDASVQVGKEVKAVQPARDAPQSSPRIQPPVVPPTPRRASKSHTPKGSPRIEAPACPRIESPSELSMEKLTQANASPYVAEAFRLGWLAGVKSNSMATNKSPSSTRSDDSQPSDPGSFVVGSRGSESGGSESRGSVSPGLTPGSVSPGSVSPGSQSPGPSDKLPTLPTMMPPPPPPTLLVPPEIPFEQLG